jgi:hypothetical protein
VDGLVVRAEQSSQASHLDHASRSGSQNMWGWFGMRPVLPLSSRLAAG